MDALITDNNGSFKCYKEYKSKLECWLEKNYLTEAFKARQLAALQIMISKLNFTKCQDVKQLAFMMWMLPEEFEILLNTGKTPINLVHMKKIILETPPAIHITGFLSGDFNDSLPYYDCLKFIGQFTNSQTVYDDCLEILYAMPEKLVGPILDPFEVGHLFGYNKHVDTSKNKFKPESKEILDSWTVTIDKADSFKHSIYQPNPTQDREYDRYKSEIKEIYLGMMKPVIYVSDGTLKLTGSEIGSDISKLTSCICLLSHVLVSFGFAFNFGNLVSRNVFDLSSETLEIIRQHLLDVSQCEPFPKDQTIKLQNDKVVEETFRFLTKENERGVDRVLSNACIWISDELNTQLEKASRGELEIEPNNKSDMELQKRIEIDGVKKILLEQIYERGLADANSKVSHNFMRMAAEDGRLWVVKYLIGKGCPVKDLPKHGHENRPWIRENRQIRDILEEKVNDPCGFGKVWQKERTKDKLRVLAYLEANNLL